MIFHNVSDSGPTGSASSWFSDIFSLPSIPTSILNSLASTSTTTFPPSSSGFKWGFGGASQVREEVKRPGQEGDLRVEDRESKRAGLNEGKGGQEGGARGGRTKWAVILSMFLALEGLLSRAKIFRRGDVKEGSRAGNPIVVPLFAFGSSLFDRGEDGQHDPFGRAPSFPHLLLPSRALDLSPLLTLLRAYQLTEFGFLRFSS